MVAALLAAGLPLFGQDPAAPPKDTPPATVPANQPQGGTGAQPQGGGSNNPRSPGSEGGLLPLLIPLVMVVLIVYFMMIRPQKKQMMEREALLNSVRKNDVVITSGGLIGRVEKLKEGEMILSLDERREVRVRVLKSAVVGVKQKGDEEEPEKKGAPTPPDSRNQG